MLFRSIALNKMCDLICWVVDSTINLICWVVDSTIYLICKGFQKLFWFVLQSFLWVLTIIGWLVSLGGVCSVICVAQTILAVISSLVIVTYGYVFKVYTVVRMTIIISCMILGYFQSDNQFLLEPKKVNSNLEVSTRFHLWVLPKIVQNTWAWEGRGEFVCSVWTDLLIEEVYNKDLQTYEAILQHLKHLRTLHYGDQREMIDYVYERMGSCDTLLMANWLDLRLVRDSLCK